MNNDRREKILLLQGIRDGKIKVSDLQDGDVFMLSHGSLSVGDTKLNVAEFLQRYKPDRDVMVVIWLGYPKPGEPTVDPSGEIMKQLIKKMPEFDTPRNWEFVEHCNDLMKRWE